MTTAENRRAGFAEAGNLDRGRSGVERPRELQGSTWRIPFEGQNLYVTVNHDGERILEVFVAGPISEGVGLLASKMLRGGFDVQRSRAQPEQGNGDARRLVQRTAA